MKIKRRAFVKGGAAAGGLAIASGMLRGNLLALSAKEPESSLAAVGEETVPTTCWIGKQDCGLLAHKVNGRLVKFEGNPIHPQNRGTLCPKGIAQISAVYDTNRVKTPLRRTNGKGITGEFEQISWDVALGIAADKMNETLAKDPRLLLWQKGRSKAKAFYDTAFVNASGATKLRPGLSVPTRDIERASIPSGRTACCTLTSASPIICSRGVGTPPTPEETRSAG